jgi:hypothetical protein
MSPKKKSTLIPEGTGENQPVEPALAAESISQVAGRGALQSETQTYVTATPPLIPTKPTVVSRPPASLPADQAWMYDPRLNDNMPLAEDTTITLLRTTTYQMPGTCPVCNEPRLGGKGKIHTTNSYKSGNMKYTLSLDFPICQKCTDIQALFAKNSNKASLLGIPFGVLALILTFVIGANSGPSGNSSSNYICIGIIAGFLVWGIAFAVINAILNSKFPKTLKDRNARIVGAANISAFNPTHVSFKFKNKTYAAAFQLLNTMGGLNLMQQMLDTLNKKQPT